MLITTTNDLPGYAVVTVLGEVFEPKTFANSPPPTLLNIDAYVTGDLDVDGDLLDGFTRIWSAARVRDLHIERPPAGDLAKAALTALRLNLEGQRAPAATLTPAPPPPPTAPLPPLPRIAALDPPLALAVRGLAARHEGAGESVIPSLYLALAPWPGVIAALPAWLGPLYAPEALRAARTSTQRAAEEAAAALLPAPGPAPAAVAGLRPTLDRFTRLVIPDLIPVCVALRDSLGAA